MNDEMNLKLSIDWKRVLIGFMVAYTGVLAVQYYDTEVFSALMINMATPLILVFATLVISRGRSLRSLDALIIAGVALWAYVAEALHGLKSFAFFSSVNFDLIYYALICFPLASILSKKRRKASLRLLFHVFIGLFFAFSVFTLYMVISEHTMYSPNGIFLGLLPEMTNRLWMFMHPNYAGTFCVIAMLLSIYLGLSAKKWPERVYCIVAFILFGVILALTDSRTCKLAASLGVGMLGFVLAQQRLRKRGNLVSIAAGVAATAVVAVACYFLFSLYGLLMQGVINTHRAGGLSLVQAAFAEEAAAPSMLQISARGMFIDEGMNGRDKIWKAALDAIRADPTILFFGTGFNRVIPTVIRYTEGVYVHLHNSFLQMLVSVGLPGLVLLLWFLFRIAVKSLRLLLNPSDRVSLASRFLPAILLACVAISFAESQFFMTDQAAYDPIFFLVAGYVSVLATKHPKEKEETVAAVTTPNS